MSGIMRGDVFYIEKFLTAGCEQNPGRPAVVVSNDMCNEFSSVIEVVYLTTQNKNSLPTHVVIKSLPRESIALCEQITSVAKERVGDWCARVSDDELSQIEEAMLVSLGLDYTNPADNVTEIVELPNMAKITAERDLYKSLYNGMLDRLLPAKKYGGG